MTPWRSQSTPALPPIGPGGWLRIALRGSVLVLLIVLCLALMALVRLVERPLFGLHRPWTPYLTQFVCRMTFVVLGLGFVSRGALMSAPGAVVANHSSWLDIFALHRRKRIYFVSKSEVASWPGIGWLARAAGTVFITREARAARAQKQVFEDRLAAGHKLAFFPEGTSTDGLQVLPFKSTLFAAFFTENLCPISWIQPVTLRYTAPPGIDARFYGWWGDMSFAPHLLAVLAASPQGMVEVTYHPALRVADFADRKTLALACETVVRAGLEHQERPVEA
ncbi:MAG: 1-acyl-sn-glycerol-3-phosphate acyltransferase [Rhodobacter sp.]|jgi:1-acyl-sn-glycerol-3-phosphate acyltransferase|nr:1-acyl-sn-glycerol-3-phosphate acyltransferase [Rhodobacter sp.]